jgi:A/G-specific adenine glycosylase
MKVGEIRRKLLAWYRASRRDLPWRRRKDPYAVWISEVMLQQTRVDTVIPYYERFLARWPTATALAAADPDEVRAAWSGLGYYRRARLMLDAAQSIAKDHDGRLPASVEGLRALPGFGRYTAGAVASIAFDLPAPAVDGNVSRVLARLHSVEGDVTTGAANERIWGHAGELAPGESPGELTQALIELGALVCTPKSPRCLICPIRAECSARADGRTDVIPGPRKKPKRSAVELTLILDVVRGAVLLERQPEGGLFASLWCLPNLEGRLEIDAIADEAERKYGWSLSRIEPRAELTHVLTHRDLHLKVVAVSGAAARGKDLSRVPLAELERHGIPTITTRALEAALPEAMLVSATLPRRRGSSARS